ATRSSRAGDADASPFGRRLGEQGAAARGAAPRRARDEPEDRGHVPRAHAARFGAVHGANGYVADRASRERELADQVVRVAVARKERVEVDALERARGNHGVAALAVGELR